MHYPWHPLVGRQIPLLYREQRRGESVALCELPDGSRAVVPAWMLDPAACRSLTTGAPRSALAALRDLRRLHDALGLEQPAAVAAPSRREGDHDEQKSVSGADPLQLPGESPVPLEGVTCKEIVQLLAQLLAHVVADGAVPSDPEGRDETRVELPESVTLRRAVIYVRQSSGIQVQENLESQRPR